MSVDNPTPAQQARALEAERTAEIEYLKSRNIALSIAVQTLGDEVSELKKQLGESPEG